MNKKTAKKLLKKVVEDYNSISDDFNTTRQYDWKEFESFLPHIKNNQKIADLGCGNGRFYKYINNKRDISYLGIDNSKGLLEKARKAHKAEFIEGDLLSIPLANENIDIAIAIASFHHIPSKELRVKSLKEIKRILKKDGKFILTVWNLFQPRYKKYIWQAVLRSILSLGKYDMRDTFIPWAKTGVKRYYYAFKAKELRKLLEENGFEILEEKIRRNITIICRKKQ